VISGDPQDDMFFEQSNKIVSASQVDDIEVRNRRSLQDRKAHALAGNSGSIKSASNQISNEKEVITGQDMRLVSSGRKENNFMTAETKGFDTGMRGF